MVNIKEPLAIKQKNCGQLYKMITNYTKLDNGLIKQDSFFKTKKEYNVDYIKERYDVYKDLSVKMSFLRLGYLLGSTKLKINKIIDVGYGNGDFLNAAKECIPNCFGAEVNDYQIPDSCIKVNDIYNDEYDVVCFFDVLEHFEDIYDIKNLKTKLIYISLPECHYFNDEWFLNWKHRRPDEHLWHFNLESLSNFMKEIGYEYVTHSNVEDTIRKPNSSYSNILSAIFKKTNTSI
jgi:hypothetical protein